MFYYVYAFTFCFLCARAIELVQRNVGNEKGGDISEKFWNPVNQILASDNAGSQMNSTVYLSVNNYYCMVDEIEDPYILLYGSKTWTFPMQDVNLTLSYPSRNSGSQFSGEDESYLITGFKVILYIDGMETKGYITSGGILKDSITLSFVSSNINTLSYQFWLYGMPKSKSGTEHLVNSIYLCH